MPVKSLNMVWKLELELKPDLSAKANKVYLSHSSVINSLTLSTLKELMYPLKFFAVDALILLDKHLFDVPKIRDNSVNVKSLIVKSSWSTIVLW